MGLKWPESIYIHHLHSSYVQSGERGRRVSERCGRREGGGGGGMNTPLKRAQHLSSSHNKSSGGSGDAVARYLAQVVSEKGASYVSFQRR